MNLYAVIDWEEFEIRSNQNFHWENIIKKTFYDVFDKKSNNSA